MWEGDDNEADNDENKAEEEEKKKNREKDDIQFNADSIIPSGNENDRAKE